MRDLQKTQRPMYLMKYSQIALCKATNTSQFLLKLEAAKYLIIFHTKQITSIAGALFFGFWCWFFLVCMVVFSGNCLHFSEGIEKGQKNLS